MPDPPAFFRIRAAMKVKDPGVAYLGNHQPQPEGRIDGWNPNEIALARVLAEHRDLYEDLSRPRLIVSHRLQSLLLESVADQVQFLPIRLLSCDGKEGEPGFAVLNALQVLTAAEARVHAARETIFQMPRASAGIQVSAPLKERCAAARLRGIEFV